MSELIKPIDIHDSGRKMTDVSPQCYKAYLVANMMWPQRTTAVAPLSAAARIRDTVPWEQYIDSSFTPLQIADIGDKMSKAHTAQHVPYVTPIHTTGKEYKVGNKRLEFLWNGAKAVSLIQARNFIESSQTGNEVPLDWLRDVIDAYKKPDLKGEFLDQAHQTVAGFFDDPANANQAAVYAACMRIMELTFFSLEGRRLSRWHRMHRVRKYTPFSDSTEIRAADKAMSELYGKEYYLSGIGGILTPYNPNTPHHAPDREEVDDRIAGYLHVAVRRNVTAKYPGLPTNWLYTG